jgi:cell division protein ZapA
VSGDKGSVTVEIFGQEYKIRGDADPEHMAEIARYVDDKMKEVAQGVPVGSLAKIGILAALNITDELFRERAEKRKMQDGIESAADRMRRKLEEIAP